MPQRTETTVLDDDLDLVQIAVLYGPVRIDFVPVNYPDVWTVTLLDEPEDSVIPYHEHGETLLAASTQLLKLLKDKAERREYDPPTDSVATCIVPRRVLC